MAGPVAVASALAYYIGWVRQEALVRHFGLDPSLLELSTRDYVVRSTDALIRFLVGVCGAALVLVGLHVLLRRALSRWPKAADPSSRLIVVIGALGLAVGAWRLARPVPLHGLYLLGPVSLTTGALCVGYGCLQLSPEPRRRLLRRWDVRSCATALAFLVLIGIFWAANDYARVQGRGRAAQLERTLGGLPVATVYSDVPLHLGARGVTEQQLGADDGRVYRYDGLRLLIRSADAFFLIPSSWSSEEGSVVMLDDTDEIRLEFSVR